ncbi:MAG: photosynthetic reaction center cytochrome c subunit family protein [Vicinamibacteria bacterium]
MPLVIALLLIAATVAPGPPPDSPDHHSKTLAFNRALGVECDHCHNPQSPNPAAPKPTYAFAQRMMRMVEGLNAGTLKDFGGITCWTCHRGNTRPARLPRERWETIKAKHDDVFVGAREERGIFMSVYAASLGVGCEHCHDVPRWEGNSKPQKGIVVKMNALFKEIPTYFEVARMPNLQCFLCHQGKVKPER